MSPVRIGSQGRPLKSEPAQCCICGITAGNSSGEGVFRYPLIRRPTFEGRQRTIYIGSIAFCDSCVLARGKINEKYRR